MTFGDESKSRGSRSPSKSPERLVSKDEVLPQEISTGIANSELNTAQAGEFGTNHVATVSTALHLLKTLDVASEVAERADEREEAESFFYKALRAESEFIQLVAPYTFSKKAKGTDDQQQSATGQESNVLGIV